MKLVLAVVHSDDASGLLDSLTKKGFRATRINTAGGFLKERIPYSRLVSTEFLPRP